MQEGKTEGQKNKAVNYEAILDAVTSPMLPDVACTIRQAQECGLWLTFLPRYRNNTVLGDQEFRDSLLIRYQCTPTDLPKHCDGCGKKLTLIHALECKAGGLIITRHNE
eukprot:10167486-Ditylum_brightwellii.AAC.1